MNELVEKNGEKVVFAGECPFCGQFVSVEVEAPWTEEELKDAAAMACECQEANQYRIRKKRKERAHSKINELFQEDCWGLIGLLDAAVELILMDHLDKITLDTSDGIKAKVSVNSKGNIKVERSVTLRRSSEV